MRKVLAAVVAYLFIMSGMVKRTKQKAFEGKFILSVYFSFPSKSLFEFCIKWLIKNKFTIISQEEVLSILRQQKEYPKGAVVITIDDGWKSNGDNIVAVAEKYRIPIAIFLSTNSIEEGHFWWPTIQAAQKNKIIKHSVESMKRIPDKDRNNIYQIVRQLVPMPRQAMTIQEVKKVALSEFVTLGGHTVTHPILIHCTDEKSHWELKKSKEKIEDWAQKKVKCFAYPNGDYSSREIDSLRKLGYRLAYTTEAAYLTKEKLQNHFELPRFCVFENISKAEAICRMMGIWQRFV